MRGALHRHESPWGAHQSHGSGLCGPGVGGAGEEEAVAGRGEGAVEGLELAADLDGGVWEPVARSWSSP
jgi:hypothetical protein